MQPAIKIAAKARLGHDAACRVGWIWKELS